MSEKTISNEIFFKELVGLAKEELTDRKQVVSAKEMYLIKNEENIKQAKEAGYAYQIIAMAATAELLEMDIPKSFTVKKKDGEEVTVETSIRVGEIKKICEPEGEE